VTYNAGMGDDPEPIALAIDIGGTFTDLAAVDRRDGSLILAKVPTTSSRLQRVFCPRSNAPSSIRATWERSFTAAPS